MSDAFSIFPRQASTQAVRTDLNFFLLLAFSCAVILLVLCLVVGFAARYRQGSTARRGPLPEALQRGRNRLDRRDPVLRPVLLLVG